MKTMRRCAVVLGSFAAVGAETVSPVAKVIQMIGDLQAKVIKEGEGAQKTYSEFAEWCEDRSRDLGHEIKTAKGEVESLKAVISEQDASSASLSAKIEDLAGDISTDTADLKAATSVRGKESKSFSAEEAELMKTTDMLKRSVQVLEKEMQKGGASMLQLQSANSLAEVVKVLVGGAFLGNSDASRLQSFIQASQSAASGEAGGDELFGAPAADAYESKSGSVVDTLQDLLEKAEDQLDSARKAEATNKHNFEMMKQSLEDEVKFSTKDMDEAKKALAAAGEKKASAEGELSSTSKDLAEDIKAKEELHHDCMSKAESFEAETKSRGEELAALGEAKKVIQEATAGSSLAQTSFLQRARATTRSDLGYMAAARLVRDIAWKEHSSALAQLASRMSSTIHASADPFAKVRGMITDMLGKLEDEASAEAEKKAYCDKELAETKAKKSDKTDDIEKLSTKIEQMSSHSAKLKEEVADLQNELSNLAKGQAEMDRLRLEESEAFKVNKAEQEKGLEGIRMALNILKDYYSVDGSHGSASGAASGIVGLLEVVESDMSKELAELTSSEETASAEYEALTKENAVEKTTKAADVKYKTKESAELDKSSAEHTSDRSGTQEELDAVLKYLSEVEAQCVAKAETYEDRTARREKELAGLKEALTVLDGETAFVQTGASRRALRGARRPRKGGALQA